MKDPEGLPGGKRGAFKRTLTWAAGLLVGSVFAVYAVQKLPLRDLGQGVPTSQSHFQWAWPTPQAGLPLPGDTPEDWVRAVYKHLAQGRSDLATELAAEMADKFPTFQLGQLIYAELLNAGLTQPWSEADLAIDADPSHRLQLNNLLHEATQRLETPIQPWREHKLPAGVHHLEPALVPHLVVVDARHSRLYWFSNRGHDGRHPQLELLFETYASVGANGVGKRNEGDLRTPVGVYTIQRLLSGRALPDFYGPGAMVLNYPNEVDQMLSRTGSGIWLHGTPSEQFSRAPLSTEGCVVLSNPDLKKILSLPALKGARVMILPQLDWVPAQFNANANDEFEAVLQRYLRSQANEQAGGLKALYSQAFSRNHKGLDAWWPKLRAARAGSRPLPDLELVSVLGWKDQTEWREVVAQEVGHPGHKNRRNWIKTYWKREPEGWRIVYEGPMG